MDHQDEKAHEAANIAVSVFRNFWDKEPVASTLEAVISAIRSDSRTKELTTGYRQQHLDALKNESMLFAVPCVFSGGKAQKNVVRLTGLSMVDFDHISLTPDPSPKGEGSDYLGLKEKIMADPHTLLCHVTISGRGLRVLYRYELDGTFELKRQMQFYRKAFAAGNAYYERLVGAEADGKCKNVTRLSVICHDDEVFYNPQAEPFTAAWIEGEWARMQEPQREQRKRQRELGRIRALYERPYLNHRCYLYLTKTTKERNRMQSNFSTLCRGHIIPREVNRETAERFMEAAEQFERIMNDSGFITLRRLTDEDIVGIKGKAGIIERYFSLQPEDNASLQDIDLDPAEMRIGDNRLCLFTLSETGDLPGRVSTDTRYERLSTDRSDCRLSFASPVGLLLPCNHIYNQYVILDNSDDNLQRFEKTARNMQSLSRYSRSNAINKEWIDEYLNEAHSQGLVSVRAHYDVIAWSDDAEELKHAKNDIGSQLASMECMPRHNTVDCPTLYWAGIPGNEADFPAEESFYTFIEPAVCLFTEETNYRSSLSPFGIKMVDRLTGKPLHIDISDLPMFEAPLLRGWPKPGFTQTLPEHRFTDIRAAL